MLLDSQTGIRFKAVNGRAAVSACSEIVRKSEGHLSTALALFLYCKRQHRVGRSPQVRRKSENLPVVSCIYCVLAIWNTLRPLRLEAELR